MKDLRDSKSKKKPKESLSSNSSKTSSKIRKWPYTRRDLGPTRSPTAQNTSANQISSSVTITASSRQKKKQWNDISRTRNNISEIPYYNCNKKGYYSKDYTEPKAKILL